MDWKRPALISSALILGTVNAGAQEFPTKPIRIVTSGAGGGSDFVSRLIAQGISGPLGQQVIIDNKPSGVVIGETGAKAAPDGYTLVIFGNGLWVSPLLQPSPYDPIRDFAPVTVVTRQPNVLVVHPSLPARDVKALVALAKANPTALNYAGGSSGSSVHLAAELFNSMAGVRTTRIPYKSAPQMYMDLIAGNVQFAFSTTSVMPLVKAHKLRALAVTSAQPSSVFPDLPPVAQTVPGYELDSIYGMLAPARTPAAVIARLNRETVQFMSLPETKARILETGSEAATSTPDEFGARMKSEIAKMSKIIKDNNIKGE